MSVEQQIADCPTPEYHRTHHYCPSCPYTSAEAEKKAALSKAEGELIAAIYSGENDGMTVGELKEKLGVR